MSKTELIELMKTCKSRSEFTENHQAKYSLVYKKYPEILNKYFPLQGHFLAKMDNFTQREFITLKIKQCDTIIQFRDKFLKAYVYAKNYHSDLLLKFYGVKQVRGLKPRYTPDDLIEFYPKLLEHYLPKVATWRDLKDTMTKNELINKMKTYRTRTLFIRTGSLYYQYCLKSFPKLIDEIFPTETYLLDEMSLSKAKNEIIKVMKSCPNRSQFKWNHAGYYNFSQKNFPGLIDEILPKQEAYANSMGELTTKLFLETLFNNNFINCRPEWLVNPRTNKKLELDGYCESLKIAFEYGSHTRIKSYIPHHDEKIKFKDDYKVMTCSTRRVRLIQLREDIFDFKKPEDKLREQLLKEFTRLNIKFSRKKFNSIQFKVVIPSHSKYTVNDIWNAVKKCKKRSDFRKKYSGLQSAAYRYGIHKYILSYFNKKYPKSEWTVSNIIKAIKTGKTRSEFRIKFPGAVASAERLGIWLELANKYLEIKKRDIGLLHNDEYLITQIKKYRTLNEIGKKDHSLYTSIFRYKKQYLLTNLGN